MPETTNNGLFVTLHSDEALQLYLEHGVYSQHQPLDTCGSTPAEVHYETLADYTCARNGTHVFFFLGRHIYYGGQVVGPEDHAAFYLNGSKTPLGDNANAPLAWDESTLYEETNEPGVFTRDSDRKYCQPYLLQFEDRLSLAGRKIRSDEFYYKLAEYPYLLKGNTIAGQGFCTLSPGETGILLELMKNAPPADTIPDPPVDISLDNPQAYDPQFDVTTTKEIRFEAQLEAVLAAHSALRPPHLPSEPVAISRQVPITPPRPDRLDQADLCFYPANSPQTARLPKHILELKRPKSTVVNAAGKSADAAEAEKIVRYLDALHGLIGEEATAIDVTVIAKRVQDGSHHSSKPPYFTDVIEPYAARVNTVRHDELGEQNCED